MLRLAGLAVCLLNWGGARAGRAGGGPDLPEPRFVPDYGDYADYGGWDTGAKGIDYTTRYSNIPFNCFVMQIFFSPLGRPRPFPPPGGGVERYHAPAPPPPQQLAERGGGGSDSPFDDPFFNNFIRKPKRQPADGAGQVCTRDSMSCQCDGTGGGCPGSRPGPSPPAGSPGAGSQPGEPGGIPGPAGGQLQPGQGVHPHDLQASVPTVATAVNRRNIATITNPGPRRHLNSCV